MTVFNSNSIPEAMKKLPQWVGRVGKIPINPNNLTGAKADISDTWGGFSAAVSAIGKAATVGGKRCTVEGIGFEFLPSTDGKMSICGIDLDHVIDPDTGEIQDDAAFLIERFDSYTEMSPSGTGVHIYYYGYPHREWGRKFNNVFADGMHAEMYQFGRYFTITGVSFGEPKQIRAAEDLAAEYQRIFTQIDEEQKVKASKGKPQYKPQEPRQGVAAPATVNSVLSDNEVIEHARRAKNGQKFIDLYDNGVILHGSHSESDMALCSHLAFWCGNDRTQVDRLFRQSALFRADGRAEKWDKVHSIDGRTYGEMTIEQACNCTDVYRSQVERRTEKYNNIMKGVTQYA